MKLKPKKAQSQWGIFPLSRKAQKEICFANFPLKSEIKSLSFELSLYDIWMTFLFKYVQILQISNIFTIWKILKL